MLRPAATQKPCKSRKSKHKQADFTKKAGEKAGLLSVLCQLGISVAESSSMSDCCPGVVNTFHGCDNRRLNRAVPFDRLGAADQRMLDHLAHAGNRDDLHVV